MISSFLVYFCTFFVSIFFAWLYSKIKQKRARYVLFALSILMPVLISTFRYGVGTDFFGYMESYFSIIYNCTNISSILSYYQEPFHVLINLLAYRIFDSYNGFLFFSSLIFMFFSFKGILKYEKKVSIVFSYFIYLLVLFSPSLNGIRQFIAVAIFFNSYKYIYGRKFLQFLLYVVLASLFHKSVILCLPLYFVWTDLGKHNKVFYFMFFSFILIIPLFSSFIQRLFEFIGVYNKYFDFYKVSSTYGFLLYILPILTVLLLVKNNQHNDPLFCFLFRLYILQAPLQLFGNYIAFADRLSLYVMPSQVILFPYFISCLKKNVILARTIVIIWYIFYYIVMFIILKSNGVYPYNFLF